LVVGCRNDVDAVQKQKRRHRGMADSLIAVDKWMVLNQRRAQGRGFVDQRHMQVVPAEGDSALGERRVQECEIANAAGAAGLLNQELVKSDHLPSDR
jgi:hypothetical protein